MSAFRHDAYVVLRPISDIISSKTPGLSTGRSTPSSARRYGQQGIEATWQQAARASQQEATAWITVSGDAAKAAVPDASRIRPATAKTFFM